MKKYILFALSLALILSACKEGITVIGNPVPTPAPIPEIGQPSPEDDVPDGVDLNQDLAAITRAYLKMNPLVEDKFYSALFDAEGDTVEILSNEGGISLEILPYEILSDGGISTSGGEFFEIAGELKTDGDGSYYLDIDIILFDPAILTAIAEATQYSTKMKIKEKQDSADSQEASDCGDTLAEQFEKCAEGYVDEDVPSAVPYKKL